MKALRLFCSLFLALTLAAVGITLPATPAKAASITVIVDDNGMNSGPIGSVLFIEAEVSGTSATGYIRFGSATNRTNEVLISFTSANTFQGVVTLPAGIPGGEIQIYAVRGTSTSGAPSDTFYVTPRITSTITSAVGDVVTIEGDGFAPSITSATSFDVYLDRNVPGRATAITPLSGSGTNASGELTNFQIAVPDATRGAHILSMRDPGPQKNYVDKTLTVTSNLTVSPTTGRAGEIVTLTGTGFAGSPVNITFNGQTAYGPSGNALTNISVPSTTGFFSIELVVPTSTLPGNHTISARDSQSVTATFSISQQITVSPNTVSVGDSINVIGSGFNPNQTAIITLDDAQVGTALVTSTGTIDTSFTLAATSKGTHTVGARVGTGAAVTTTILVQSKVTNASPTSGSAGSIVTISGTGFTPGAADVNMDGTKIGSITVGNNGSFTNATVTIPVGTLSGTYALTVQGVSAGNFTVDPKLTLTPSSGSWGDKATIEGIGFSPQKAITFSLLDANDKNYGITTDQNTVVTKNDGSFTATFEISALPKGQYTLRATDSDNNSGESQLTINTKINQLDPSTGIAEDLIGIVGTGFAANKPITITFGDQVASTTPSPLSTNDSGWFSALFTVPAMPAGNITITVSDGVNTATTTFTLKSSLEIDPLPTAANPAWIGMDVKVTGIGFRASSPVTITFDDNPDFTATGTTNAQGSFTLSFKVPSLAAGTNKLKVSNGTTVLEYDFVIESTPPAAPAQLKPLTAGKPKQPVVFSWGDVSDPSGVTYDFQLSQDPAFKTLPLTLDVYGLTETTLTLPADQKLPSAGSKNPYVWRVRAVDGAGNVGEWSTVNTFTIGFAWPSWLIHVWYSLGILVALAFGIWFGRRMAYQSY